MCHCVCGDGASDSYTDQSRLQLDPGSGIFFNYYPLSIQWAHGTVLGARDLSRMLQQGKKTQLVRLSLCVNQKYFL